MKTGKPDDQKQSGEGQQYGEGNYKATRQYNEGLKEHVQNHDIEKEARDAAPKTPDIANRSATGQHTWSRRA